MTRNGSNLGANKASVQNGYGENTLVWVPSGANANNGSARSNRTTAEDVYTVSINGVEVGGQTESYFYDRAGLRSQRIPLSLVNRICPRFPGVSSLDPGDE